MYQEIKVFEPTYVFDEDIYLCRGLAVNFSHGAGKTYWPAESRLLLTKNQKKQLEDDMQEDIPVRIYKYVAYVGAECKESSWFMSRDDALACPLAKEYPDGKQTPDGEYINGIVDDKILDTTSIAPVKFPMVVDLMAGKDGRLSCRINLHPELDGYDTKGMVCFPDKSMTDACAGKALINGIKEKGTYGFLMGSMVQYGMPDWEKFLDYAWNNLASRMDEEFLFVNHPGLGRFLYSNGHAWLETATSPYCKVDNEFHSGVYDVVSIPDAIEIEPYVEDRMTLGDMFLEDAFGDKLTKQNLLDLFPFYKIFTVRYSENWERSNKLMPDIIKQAIAEGILNLVWLPGNKIYALDIVRSALYRLSAFSIEEIKKMAAEYTRINDEAKRSIMSQIKKGTLRLRNIA